jgi:hypothetical protein
LALQVQVQVQVLLKLQPYLEAAAVAVAAAAAVKQLLRRKLWRGQPHTVSSVRPARGRRNSWVFGTMIGKGQACFDMWCKIVLMLQIVFILLT